MDSRRELRLYPSIPTILLLLLLFGSITAGGWWAWITRHSIGDGVVAVIVLCVGGIGLLLFLAWFATAIIVRTPLLIINDNGFIASRPITSWRHVVVPWTDVWGIGVQTQILGGNRSVRPRVSYLAVYERDEGYEGDEDGVDDAASELETASGPVKVNLKYVYAPILVQFNMFFLFATRKRRAQVLERIKTTFAPEIIQHNIWVDKEERPL